MIKACLLSCLLLVSSGVIAATDKPDVVVIETTIIGGKQAPKFLSIVPWRLQRQMTLSTQPTGLQHKRLKPLEPQEFERTLGLLTTKTQLKAQ